MKFQHYLASGILVGSVLVGAPVLAQSVDGTNVWTGASSTNKIDIVEEIDTTTIQSTTTQSTNAFNLDLKTGGNTVNDNTGNGITKSGSIDVTLKQQDKTVGDPELTTFTNQSGSANSSSQTSTIQSLSQESKITMVNNGPAISVRNENTGAESENLVDVKLTKTIITEETHTRVEENVMNLAFNTGDNEASENTGSGVAESGRITLTLVKKSLPAPKPKLPAPLVPTAPTQPSPTSEPTRPGVAAPAQPVSPPQPTTVPTPAQELKPVVALKLAQLAPSQPTQLITPAAQPVALIQPTPAVPEPEKKLPKAGAETPILATIFSLGVMRYRRHRHRQRFELLYLNKKP